MQARLPHSRFVLLEFLIERKVAAPELLHEQAIDNAGSLYQFDQRLLVSCRKRRRIYLQSSRSKAGRHLVEFIHSWRGRSGFLGGTDCHGDQNNKKDSAHGTRIPQRSGYEIPEGPVWTSINQLHLNHAN